MSITPTSIKWYYYDGDSWEDFSSYVLTNSGVSGSWGMGSGDYTDRLAQVGEMRMRVDNREGKFDPDDADVLTGWAINTKVKLEVVYDGVTYRRFYGTVKTINFSEPNTKEMTADVTVVDWMVNAYDFNIRSLSIETFRTADWAVDTIVDATGKTPLATKYSAGNYTYPALFDSMTDKTTAATELNKVVLSENGYFYCKHDRVNGETLVFETNTDRTGARTIAKLPCLISACGFIEKEADTDNILQEDGTSKIILDAVQDAHINETADGYERAHGENIINYASATAHPKRVDATSAVLYSLGTPMQIAAGQTKTIKAGYMNASTKEKCNALTDLMTAPVATTDYTMNTKKDGTGTNQTSELAVTAVFKSAEVVFTLKSTSTSACYITKLQCRGYGIYTDAVIKYEEEDTTSQAAYGFHELNIDQIYQRDAMNSEAMIDEIVFVEKDPRTKLNRVTMIANKSSTHMLAFLNVDIGDMVKITESNLGIADYYYVNGIEFQVMEGNVIVFSWILSELSYTAYVSGGLTAVSTEHAPSGGYGKPIDYGYIPELFTKEITVIASIYPHTVDLDGSAVIFATGSSIGTWQLCVSGVDTAGLKIWFVGNQSSSGQALYYSGEETAMAANNWYRIAVRWNPYFGHTLGVNNIFYVNGTIQTTLIFDRATGEINTSGYSLSGIGGFQGSNGLYYGNFDGLIKNVKVYNRLLDADEITADAAGTHISEGLVFWGPFCPTQRTASYYDAALTESQKLFDAAGGRMGTPRSAPTCREIT